MDVVVWTDRIEVKARVSNEEAFVAEAFGEKSQDDATLERVWTRHGQYLLTHLQLSVDEIAITGRVVDIVPPKECEESPSASRSRPSV